MSTASTRPARSTSGGSMFTVDFFLAAALCAAHILYTYHVYETYTSPLELQALHWWLPLLATVLYGSMIFFGKRLMASRAPINPKNAMLLYNLYQSLINGFMAVWLVYQAATTLKDYTIWGNYEDHSPLGYKLAFGLWMHYNNKYLELFDTFFMIVKKKDEQVSFLHVYHHILLVWSWYVCILYCIGGDAYFGSAFNSLVHFFMYGYYALALFQIPCPWKKHLTMFQMIQFCFCASQSLYVFYAGNIWWFVPALQLFVMLNMLYLFSKFYAKKYNKQGATAAKKKVNPVEVSSKSSAEFSFEGASPAERTKSPPPHFSTALVDESEAAFEQHAAQPSPVAASPKSSSSKKKSTKSGSIKKRASTAKAE